MLREEYFNVLANNILEAIDNTPDYYDKEFMIIKLNILYNLRFQLMNEQSFNDSVETLRQHSLRKGK